nr:MAG: hypothetical protein [Molluscum contagiosum virus]
MRAQFLHVQALAASLRAVVRVAKEAADTQEDVVDGLAGGHEARLYRDDVIQVLDPSLAEHEVHGGARRS